MMDRKIRSSEQKNIKQAQNGARQIKYGLLSTLRAKGRTVLFTLLILILTLALTLGIGMLTYSRQMLAKMDSQYTSIALLEYMGEDYPDEDASDQNARDTFAALDDNAVSAVDGVEFWERKDMALGYLEGYKRINGAVPYADYGVLAAGRISSEGYGVIDRSLYAKKDRDGKYCHFILPFEPQKDKKYLLHGYFADFGFSTPVFITAPFYEGCEISPIAELTEENEYLLTEGIFAEYADFYNKANNAVRLYASKNIASLDIFQQGTLYIADGRFPEASETNVCVIDGSTAERMDVKVGDSIEISVHTSDPGYIYDIKDTGEMRKVKVVGITNIVNDYDGHIWLLAEEEPLSETFYGYELGRAVLDNSKARKAADDIRSVLPDSIRVTLYDQGYSAAAQPIQAVGSAAITLMAASACGALVVLFLFGYLFVGRQRETVQVLVSLGTPGKNIRMWLLSGASFISAFAAVLGASTGYMILNSVIQTALSAARALYVPDVRYSNSAMGTSREMAEIEGVSAWCAVIAAAAIFIAALLMCIGFVQHARKEHTPQKGRSTAYIPKGKTSLVSGGALRFALLSMRRGGRRSAVVPAAALVLTVLLGLLASESQNRETSMLNFYENSIIEGQAVSTNGRSVSNLVIPIYSVRKLWQSGNLKDISVSVGWTYSNFKIGADDGSDQGYVVLTPPDSRTKSPELIALNDLEAATEFYYTGKPDVEWLEGWDESFLSDTQYYSAYESGGEAVRLYTGTEASYLGDKSKLIYPVLAGNDFMDTNELSLGDVFSIKIDVGNYFDYRDKWPSGEMSVSLKIVGSFKQVSKRSNLYVPLSFWCDPTWITGEKEILAADERIMPIFSTAEERTKYFYSVTTLKTCNFTLRSTYELEDLRGYLAEEEYSQVGKFNRNRTTILLYDQTFTETVSGLGRYITFSRILLPVLFAAVGLLGFVISWLMINGRRMEFAIMRGLGASGRRVFMSFFLEQGMLCLIGCIVGALLLICASFGAVRVILLAAAAFCICYLAGCALSVAAAGRTKLMALLSERE